MEEQQARPGEQPRKQPKKNPTIGTPLPSMPPAAPRSQNENDAQGNEREQEQASESSEQKGTDKNAPPSLGQAQQVANVATGGTATQIALKSPLFSWLQKPFPVLFWIFNKMPIISIFLIAVWALPFLWVLLVGLSFLSHRTSQSSFSAVMPPKTTAFEMVAAGTLAVVIVTAAWVLSLIVLCTTAPGLAVKGLAWLNNVDLPSCEF